MMRALAALMTLLALGCTVKVTPTDSAGNPATTGTISGTLRFDAPIPKNPVRDDMGQKRDLLWVDPDSKGWGNIAVWLEIEDGSLPSRADVSQEEAIVIEQIDFAFQAAVFSRSIDTAMAAYAGLDASAVMVNDHTAFRTDWMPFAGLGPSGLGVGGMPHTMSDMRIEKMLVIKSPALTGL